MAGLISPATLEQIRAASDIVEVIGGYLPLKRAGGRFVTLCPFHKEKTPSFSVNPSLQIFHCFGCHKGGDVFTFVREYENLSFVEAVRRLAERARIPLAMDDAPDQGQGRHVKETLRTIHEQITQRWQACLANEAAGQRARDYLAQRGVSAEAIKLFRLGAAPEVWDDTVNWARSKGHDPALVEQAGLILRKEGSDHYYDRFRGRLIFPICDEQGRPIGFSGRVLSGDEKTAKYVNSPETPLFTKGRVLFGLDKARRPMLDAGFAVICEGQLDLIACHTAGVQNIVAPQGTAFTADHARILKRYVEEVVLCFDSDTAGQNAAVRALDDLLTSGLAIRVATVPAPHDPDSFIRAQGAEAFRKLIAEAEGYFDFFLRRLCELNDPASDKGRLAIVRAMRDALARTGSAVLADTYAQKTAQRLGVAPEAMRAEFKRSQSSPRAAATPASPTAESESPPLPRPAAAEFWLLKLLLIDDELAPWAATHLDPQWIQHAIVRQVVSRRLLAESDRDWHGVAGLLAELEGLDAQALVTEAVSDPRPIPNRLQQLQDVTVRLRNQHLDAQLTVLVRSLDDSTLPESDRNRCLQAQQQLREQKRAPLTPLADAH